MRQIGEAVRAFRLLRSSTTKATDHALRKYDNFTRYGQGARWPSLRESASSPQTPRTTDGHQAEIAERAKGP
jgi:hypothetical protein